MKNEIYVCMHNTFDDVILKKENIGFQNLNQVSCVDWMFSKRIYLVA